jgi:hypothetical protein
LIDAGHRAGRHGASALVSSPYATLDQVFLNRLKVVYMSLARSEKRRCVSKSRSVIGAGLSESSYLRVRVRDLGRILRQASRLSPDEAGGMAGSGGIPTKPDIMANRLPLPRTG